MFVTHPLLREQVPLGLLSEGSNAWSAVTLELNVPWFALAYRIEGVIETMLVAWDIRLIEIIEDTGVEPFVRLSRISPGPTLGSWKMIDIDQVWLPKTDSGIQGAFLFRERGNTILRCSATEKTSSGTSLGETLLLDLSLVS